MTEGRVWVLQRIASVFVLPLTVFHLLYKAGLLGGWVGLPVRYAAALALLFCLLFHGLYGLRTVIHDYVKSSGLLKRADRVIVTFGLFLLLYGGWGLWVFFRPR